MISDVCKTTILQVREQVFVKNGQIILVDDLTVRFHFGRTNIDVAYDTGYDLYVVTTHKLGKDYTSTSDTVSGVYAEDLAKFFPKRLVKDANVRAMFALISEAKKARA